MSTTRLAGIEPGSVGLFSGALNGQPAEVQRRVARQAESLGFSALWYGESTPGRESFAQGAVFLAATSRIVVASGIANIYARDAYAAQAAARTLAEAFGNRFILGLGVSHAPNADRRGHTYVAPVQAMRTYLDGLDAAINDWRGVTAPMPPVLLGALRSKMVQLAAERTAGAFTYFVTDEHTRQTRRLVGDDAFLAVDLPVVLESDAVRARAIGSRYTSRYLKVDNYRHSLREQGFSEEDIEPPGSPRLLDSLVAWGTPGRIAERVASRLEAGADHVVLNIATEDPRVPYDKELDELAPVAKLG